MANRATIESKARLADPATTPVGGWRFKHPKANRIFYGANAQELLDRIRSYEQANNLPPTANLFTAVQDWICRQPGNEERCIGLVKRSGKDYLYGAAAHLQAKLMGDSAFVDSGTAEKRAAVCANCPHNTMDKDDSRLAQYSDEVIRAHVGDRYTSLDDKLFTCRVCSCVMRSKVHYAREIVIRYLPQRVRGMLPRGNLKGRDGKPVFCWQLAEPK